MDSPKPVRAEAFGVTIVPMVSDHLAQLAAATSPEDFRFYPSKPATFDLDGWTEFLGKLQTEQRIAHTILVGSEVAGMTSFLDIQPDHRKLEIGATMVLAPWRGSRLNPASKLLLMSYAFEEWGAIRVQLKGDARNRHSMEAMRRNGFTEEGTLRHFQLLSDGHKRDVTFFSVTDEEWPTAKAHLIRRCEESPLKSR